MRGVEGTDNLCVAPSLSGFSVIRERASRFKKWHFLPEKTTEPLWFAFAYLGLGRELFSSGSLCIAPVGFLHFYVW